MVAYRRSYDAIKDVGRNVTVAWKPDSTALAVTVATLHVIIAKKCHAWKGNSWIIFKKKHVSNEALSRRVPMSLV